MCQLFAHNCMKFQMPKLPKTDIVYAYFDFMSVLVCVLSFSTYDVQSTFLYQ